MVGDLGEAARTAVRGLACVLAALLVAGCERGEPSAVEITRRAWRAHEIVVGAGERARTCAEAGAAMQRALADHRQAFVVALALDRDPDRLATAAAYIRQHERHYRDIETRMIALSDRCGDDPTVAAAFHQMGSP
jgi:hypothetical protein